MEYMRNLYVDSSNVDINILITNVNILMIVSKFASNIKWI